MVMFTPPERQGQIVEWSYGDACNGTMYRCRYDRSDRSEQWWKAEYVDLFPDCEHDSDCPCWSPQNTEPRGCEEAWVPCDSPCDEPSYD